MRVWIIDLTSLFLTKIGCFCSALLPRRSTSAAGKVLHDLGMCFANVLLYEQSVEIELCCSLRHFLLSYSLSHGIPYNSHSNLVPFFFFFFGGGINICFRFCLCVCFRFLLLYYSVSLPSLYILCRITSFFLIYVFPPSFFYVILIFFYLFVLFWFYLAFFSFDRSVTPDRKRPKHMPTGEEGCTFEPAINPSPGKKVRNKRIFGSSSSLFLSLHSFSYPENVLYPVHLIIFVIRFS